MRLLLVLILTIGWPCVFAARRPSHQIQYPDETERPYDYNPPKGPAQQMPGPAEETKLAQYEYPLLDIRLLGALYKLRIEQNIDLELVKVNSATRRPTGVADDDIYTIDAVLGPNNQRCTLIMVEEEDELYYNLDITCGSQAYHVAHGISRDERINNRISDVSIIKIDFVHRAW